MTEYLFGSSHFACQCQNPALYSSDYEALDVRDLYEKSKALLSSVAHHFSDCQLCSNCQQNTKQKNDRYARLKTILAILIRRLNNLKDKEPVKYFIALFSNFCFIFPHVDSSAFLVKFNNKFYRRVTNSITFCYQQWANTQNQPQKAKQLLRLSTLLCSLSKLAKDLKNNTSTQIVIRQKLFSPKLIRTVLLLKLPKHQNILGTYQELFNFILRQTSKKPSDHLAHILKSLKANQLYECLYNNLIENDQSLTHRSYYLSFSILQQLVTRHYKCESQQSLIKIHPRSIEMMSRYCQKTIIRYGFEVYTGQRVDLAIMKVAINFMVALGQPYLLNCGASNVSYGLVKKLVGHPDRSEFLQSDIMNTLLKDLKDTQLKNVIMSLMKPLIGRFREFEACSQKMEAETSNIYLQRNRTEMCKIYRQITQQLSSLQNCCCVMSEEVCYWLIDNGDWEISGMEQKSWTLFNRMFKEFLRFEKIFPIPGYKNSNVYWVQSLMVKIINKCEDVPEILFVLKNQFCLQQLNMGQSDRQNPNILLDILNRRVSTTSPQQINPLHYIISDFISRSNMLGNNHQTTKQWNLVQSPPKDPFHLI